MWHIMLCGLLALPASIELGPRENRAEVVLTEPKCESCPTCAKCAKCAKDEEHEHAKNDVSAREPHRKRIHWRRPWVIRR